MEISGKTGSIAYRLARSLKVIGADTDRSGTHGFLLTFYMGLHRFQIGRKIANFRKCGPLHQLKTSSDPEKCSVSVQRVGEVGCGGWLGDWGH